MGLFKFQNYSAIKNLSKMSRVKEDEIEIIENYLKLQVTKIIKNGYTFKKEDNFRTVSGEIYGKAAVPFANNAEVKMGEVWIAMNETLNCDDYQIEVGEYVNAVNLNNMIGELVEMSSDLCTTTFSEVSVGDILVPIPAGTDEMKWKKTSDTGYGICFEVVEKTTFGTFTIDAADGGYTCRIKSN